MGFDEKIYEMLIIDYLILNRDRHGANIEILYNKKTKKYRIAPFFDHGLALLFNTSEDQSTSIDVLEDKKTNAFIGGSSTFDNLKIIPKDKFPKLNKLSKKDKDYIFKDLEDIITKNRIDKIWEMIWERWCNYENLFNQK